jgi:hypothetical protein
MHTARTLLLHKISLSFISSAIDEVRLGNNFARINIRIIPLDEIHNVWKTVSTTRRLGLLRISKESGEQPRRSWMPWRWIVKSWTFFAFPIITSRLLVCNLHSHVRHVSRLWLDCQRLPRYAKQIWPGDVGLGRLTVRWFPVCPRY